MGLMCKMVRNGLMRLCEQTGCGLSALKCVQNNTFFILWTVDVNDACRRVFQMNRSDVEITAT